MLVLLSAVFCKLACPCLFMYFCMYVSYFFEVADSTALSSSCCIVVASIWCPISVWTGGWEPSQSKDFCRGRRPNDMLLTAMRPQPLPKIIVSVCCWTANWLPVGPLTSLNCCYCRWTRDFVLYSLEAEVNVSTLGRQYGC